jgi:FAD/FMN-containing dehydrogenase
MIAASVLGSTMTLADTQDSIGDRLKAIVGAKNVFESESQRVFFSTDIAKRGETAALVVRVGSTEQTSAVLRCCAAAGVPVVPRGGGFSYTGGYMPVVPGTILIDMRGNDAIIEINAEDMYVRVATGCTWQRLYEALKAKGLRTPYYGPMSGYHATVGGALSQGSFFLGSTEYGTTADSVLSLEVVLANGDVIHTGSDSGGATVGPFFRNYGPDLTGLFLADTGSLGFKTVATLKLIRFPQHQAYGSFSFDDGHDALAALSEIGRAGLAAEAYAWDPFFVDQMRQASLGTAQDARFLWNTVRNSAGIIDGISAATRMALNGKRVFKAGTHIVQVTMDDLSAAGAAGRLKLVRAIALRHNAFELSPSIPRALRGTPFVDFNVAERRTKLRNLPTNGLYPHSRAAASLTAIRKLFAAEQPEMDRVGLSIGVVYFAVGKNAMAIEPLFYWTDEEHFLHDRVKQTSDLAELATYTDRPDATHYAMALRDKLKAVMSDNGAVHVQIGKSYNYLPSREPRIAKLVTAIKAQLDPDSRVNPGSLGLGL